MTRSRLLVNSFTFEMHALSAYEARSPGELGWSIMVFPRQFEVEPASTLENPPTLPLRVLTQALPQTGYPTSRYADLAETAGVLIADNATDPVHPCDAYYRQPHVVPPAPSTTIAVTGNANPILSGILMKRFCRGDASLCSR